MEIQNELRRVNKKIKLFEQEALNWVLSDLIEQIDKDIEGTGVPQNEKTKMINKLKRSYQKYIKDNTPGDSKQIKLL